MAYIIATFLTSLFAFIVAEAVAAFLPKRFRPYLVLRSLVLAWIGFSLFNVGFFGAWSQPTPKTVATLMEQVRGDELHWNQYGKPATKWEEKTHRQYKKTCQGYAIEQLGELGPEASEAVPELIEIFNEQGDHNSGDGVYEMRSGIARTLGAIGEAEAIEPMIEMLLKKSLSSEEEYGSAIRWHDREYESSRIYLKRGHGPQAILMGLMLMPSTNHSEIVERLKIARSEIELSERFNDWSKFEIDRGIRFFEADRKTQNRLRSYVAGGYWLDDAEFEKMLDLAYVRPR